MDWLSEILSFLAGLVTGGFAMKFSMSKSNSDNVNQNNIKAGGDVAGRDIKK